MLNLVDLLRVPQVDTGLRFAISPDGRSVAFAWNKTGNWEIYELDLASTNDEQPHARKVTGGAGAKFSPQYSPDGKNLAFALDWDGSESYHIMLLNRETGSQTNLTPNGVYAHQPNFSFSPHGETLAVLSDERGQFALYLLSIPTGEKRLLLDLHRPIWDVSWSPNGKWIVVEAEMEASDRGLFLVNIETGESEQIQAGGQGLNAQQPAWSPDSNILTFSAQSGEWFDIAHYEMETRTLFWLTQEPGDNTLPCWSRHGGQLSWVHADGVVNSISVKREGSPVRQVLVSAGIHHHPRFTPQGDLLFLFESPVRPPDLWKLSPAGTFKQLTNSLPQNLETTGFGFPREVSYEHAGAHVPALLFPGQGKYAVINIHGGPNWHVQFLWDPFMLHMASRGWTVLAPNYRGSTGYGRSWQITSRFDMGGVDTRDCAAGAEYLKQAMLADRIAVTGRSHGGYLTMTCLTKFPDLWCGGSAVVPFLDWFHSHDASREDLQHWNIENMGDPKENYDRWHNASPYFFLDRVSAPVQLICGANDPRCPASESLAARDKLIELGKEVELFLYADEGHSFLKIENVIDAEMKRMKFLADVLEQKKP